MMIRSNWTGVVIGLVTIAMACSPGAQDPEKDQQALARVDSLFPNGLSDATLTAVFDAEDFAWAYEQYPAFFGASGLDSMRIQKLVEQGLTGRYIAIANRPASGTSLFGGSHVRLEVYMDSAGLSVAKHRSLLVVK